CPPLLHEGTHPVSIEVTSRCAMSYFRATLPVEQVIVVSHAPPLLPSPDPPSAWALVAAKHVAPNAIAETPNRNSLPHLSAMVSPSLFKRKIPLNNAVLLPHVRLRRTVQHHQQSTCRPENTASKQAHRRETMQERRVSAHPRTCSSSGKLRSAGSIHG